MKITFLNHASFIIEMNNFKICIDPYLFGSAFNNGWSLLSEENHNNELKDITHIFYSHEHPDHFSIPFLKNIKKEDRNKIKILYQETYDKRLKRFCEGQGFAFKELDNNKEIKLFDNLLITCGKVPFQDSWVNFNIENKNILNVNDCVLENPKFVYEIKKILNRKINILFTQFSYANSDVELNQENLALKQLEKIKLQDEILAPENIVPFASFIYFSSSDNKYMNKNINTAQSVFEYINDNCNANPIILKPNMVLETSSKINNKISLDYWNNLYQNIDKLKYHKTDITIDENILIDQSKDYLKRIKKNNNFLLINLLSKLKFFPKINIFITDLKKYFSFDLISGLNLKDSAFTNEKSISLNSNSLSYIFNFDYGFETLTINARFQSDSDYFLKVKKCLFLGSLNNTGRYIRFSNLYKFINTKLVIRSLELFNFKKRQF
jgi:UDP-MurNAc hydroxylase